MQTMYDGLVNSPETTTTNNISNSDTIIYLLDPSRVPADLPNLMTLGTGTNAETVKVTAIDGSAITVERGFQGTPAAWNAGTIIARNFTEYDYNALKENILELEADKEELIKDATAKTTPVDADTMPLSDSAASGATKKITWANIKAALKTYFDTLYVTLTSVANNLTTTAAGYVLDARQGKVLGDLISSNNRKRNLLHNWDFRNPVNQRGASSYATSGASIYSIDRWGIGYYSTLTVNSGSISIAQSAAGMMFQRIEEYSKYDGETLTFSVDIGGTIYTVAATIDLANPSSVSVAVPNGTIKIVWTASSIYVGIQPTSGYTIASVIRCKLEIGTESTLENDAPADYGEQLALCQRYYIKYASGLNGFGAGSAAATSVPMRVHLPVPMRTTPSIVSFTRNYIRGAGASLGTPSATTVSSLSGNELTLLSTVSCTALQVYETSFSAIEFSADL